MPTMNSLRVCVRVASLWMEEIRERGNEKKDET